MAPRTWRKYWIRQKYKTVMYQNETKFNIEDWQRVWDIPMDQNKKGSAFALEQTKRKKRRCTADQTPNWSHTIDPGLLNEQTCADLLTIRYALVDHTRSLLGVWFNLLYDEMLTNFINKYTGDECTLSSFWVY